MPEIQLQSGIYKIEYSTQHNLIATRGKFAVEQGVPVIARGLLLPPVFQEWQIERTSESLPGQYSISLVIEPGLYIVEGGDKIWANEVPPESWTIVAGPKGFTIRSQKGKVWGQPQPNGQIPLVESNDAQAAEGWHFEHLGILG